MEMSVSKDYNVMEISGSKGQYVVQCVSEMGAISLQGIHTYKVSVISASKDYGVMGTSYTKGIRV
jgi:hypothetical protein